MSKENTDLLCCTECGSCDVVKMQSTDPTYTGTYRDANGVEFWVFVWENKDREYNRQPKFNFRMTPK